MRFLPPKTLAFLVALMVAGLGLVLSACGGSDDYDKYNISAARINAMCPKTGIAQTSLTSDEGYQSATVTCRSGKVGKIDSWAQPDQPAETTSNASGLPAG